MPVWNVFLPHSSDEPASRAHKPLRNQVIARAPEVLHSKQETRCDTTKDTRPGAALAPRPQKRKCAARPRPTTSCVAGLGLGRLPLQSRIQRLLLLTLLTGETQPEKTGGRAEPMGARTRNLGPGSRRTMASSFSLIAAHRQRCNRNWRRPCTTHSAEEAQRRDSSWDRPPRCGHWLPREHFEARCS